MNPTELFLWPIYDFLSLKNDVNVASKNTGNKQKKFLVAILKVTDENSRIRTKVSRIRNMAYRG